MNRNKLNTAAVMETWKVICHHPFSQGKYLQKGNRKTILKSRDTFLNHQFNLFSVKTMCHIKDVIWTSIQGRFFISLLCFSTAFLLQCKEKAVGMFLSKKHTIKKKGEENEDEPYLCIANGWSRQRSNLHHKDDQQN